MLKSRDIPLPKKGPSSESYGFSSSHVWMWELDYKESWAPKNWCFWTVVLEKTLESPLDSKEIQPFNPKGNQSWIFTGRTDAEAETPILWPPDAKNWLWKITWCWERLKVGGEGNDREWDGWMASPTQWTWVWASFRSWWCTGKPGMLQSMGLQRVGHDWVTELNWLNLACLLDIQMMILRKHLKMGIWRPRVKNGTGDTNQGVIWKAKGEEGSRGWDSWVTSLIQWTGIWANS